MVGNLVLSNDDGKSCPLAMDKVVHLEWIHYLWVKLLKDDPTRTAERSNRSTENRF